MTASKIIKTVLLFVGTIGVTCDVKSIIGSEERCYDDLGCLVLDKQWYHPWRRPINLWPQDPEVINTKFYLHVRPPSGRTTHEPEGIALETRNKLSLSLSPLDANKPTKIIIHGHREDAGTDWVMDLTEALIQYGDYNVIRVDWSNGAKTSILQAVANARLVGLEVTKLINSLIDSFNIPASSLHIIGYALGAHAAAYSGERVPGTGRITGLSPSALYFEEMPEVVRLDEQDAHFVDIIHTSTNGDGTDQRCGTVDFYPNGGGEQPGCGRHHARKYGEQRCCKSEHGEQKSCRREQEEEGCSCESEHGKQKSCKREQDEQGCCTSKQNIEDLKTNDFSTSQSRQACSQMRAAEFFLASLTCPDCFLGHECTDPYLYADGMCYSCGEPNIHCAYLGVRAEEFLTQGRNKVPLQLTTSKGAPFNVYPYRLWLSLAHPEAAEEEVEGELTLTLKGQTDTLTVTLPGDPVHLSHGQPKGWVLGLEKDLGAVEQVTVVWQYKTSPFHPCLFPDQCNTSLYIQSLKVSPIDYLPESNRESNTRLLCNGPQHTEMVSGVPVPLLAFEHCREWSL